MTGAERLQALRSRLEQMPDCQIIARLGDINQRGRAEAAITGLLVSAQECRSQLTDEPERLFRLSECEPGIEAMLVDAADRWERVLY